MSLYEPPGREMRVFVSSTSKDMQAEREEVSKRALSGDAVSGVRQVATGAGR